MRLGLAALAALVPSIALARPLPTVRDSFYPRTSTPHAQVSSRIIYLHRCPPGIGCAIHPGNDDSRTDTSSLAQQDVSLSPFSQSDEVWQRMVACVKATYAPFNIEVTDVDPGTVPHFENIVGGRGTQLDPSLSNAGGVAVRTCEEIPNAVSFTFDVYGPDPDTLCWTASQETAHMFGLDHEYNANDPMTYLSGGPSMKRFQPTQSRCGEYAERDCDCGNATQSSYQAILDLFGQGVVTPPMVTIKLPKAGTKVTPGFRVTAAAMDDVGIERVELWIDNANTDSVATTAPYILTAPLDLEEGAHHVQAIAYDVQGGVANADLDVDVGPPCSTSNACSSADACVMGVCLPGKKTPGGMGSVCNADTECLSNQCAALDGEKQCVEVCDPILADACGAGFSCLDDSAGGGVCWYEGDGGGCCDAGGAGPLGPSALAFVLGTLIFRRRRR
ncbi:hypothetical protein BH11MYX2_BH11MYX2_10630 [soil metagenome]